MIPGLEKDKGPWKEISSVSVINATPAFLREFLWSVQPLLQVRWPWDYTKVVFYFFFFLPQKRHPSNCKELKCFFFWSINTKNKSLASKNKDTFFFFLISWKLQRKASNLTHTLFVGIDPSRALSESWYLVLIHSKDLFCCQLPGRLEILFRLGEIFCLKLWKSSHWAFKAFFIFCHFKREKEMEICWKEK